MAELPWPDPLLTDGAVRLRAWTEGDLGAIVAACQDPLIARYSPVVPWPYAASDARAWLSCHEPDRRAGRALELAITDARAGAVLGAVALSDVHLQQERSGVGYWLASGARGRGVASGAVRLLAAWAFDVLGVARLELVTHPDNAASQRVAERCGFVREGILRSHALIRSSRQRRDSVMYGLLPPELQ